MDLTASAIKPGRRSLNRTSMDVRRARGAIKDPSHAKSRDVGGATGIAGAGAGRLTSSRVPRRRATPCRRRRRSTVAVHTAIVVATVVVATARRLVARLPHTSTYLL